MEHSPLPWKVETNEYGSTRIVDNNYDTLYGDKNNAKYIVEACNSYPTLKQSNEQMQQRVKELSEMITEFMKAAKINLQAAMYKDERVLYDCYMKAEQLLNKEG